MSVIAAFACALPPAARDLMTAGSFWIARACARDFVRDYIRRLVRDRLLTGLVTTTWMQWLLFPVMAVLFALLVREPIRFFGTLRQRHAV